MSGNCNRLVTLTLFVQVRSAFVKQLASRLLPLLFVAAALASLSPAWAQSPTAETPAAAPEGDQPTAQRYIRDWLSVAVRATPTQSGPTVHSGLVSGTPLTVLETDASREFSRVRTADGVVGWVPTRFLSDQPAARDRLTQIEAELARLTQRNSELEAERAGLPPGLAEAGERLRELEQRNTELVAELTALRERPDDIGVLQAANAELESNNAALVDRIDSLSRELAELRSGERHQQFINGGAAVLAGIIATLLIAWLWPRKKRTEWG